jgi:hypothetical protein
MSGHCKECGNNPCFCDYDNFYKPLDTENKFYFRELLKVTDEMKREIIEYVGKDIDVLKRYNAIRKTIKARLK